jgi:hypothetical protein
LYDTAVKVAVNRISSSLQISEESVKENLNFLDTRKTAPILDHIYGEETKFSSCVENAHTISDQHLSSFVNCCQRIFLSTIDITEKAAIHFFLFGVIKQYRDYIAQSKKIRTLKPPITFSNIASFGVFFDKSPLMVDSK